MNPDHRLAVIRMEARDEGLRRRSISRGAMLLFFALVLFTAVASLVAVFAGRRDAKVRTR